MKLDSPKVNKKTQELYTAILSIKTEQEARCFFRDLLTENEIEEFAQRFYAAKLLWNKTPYSIVEKKTGMSSTTVARVNKWLNNGTNGYLCILNRLTPHHHTSPSFVEDDL